jgi:hypothetical protein
MPRFRPSKGPQKNVRRGALPSDDLSQRGKQAIYFLLGVVVDEANAQEAAGFFHVESLGEVESVVVPVPGKEAAVAEFGGEGKWSLIFVLINNPNCECGASPVVQFRRSRR